MKIFVITCDYYIHVLKGFVYMFNKYWASDTSVIVLGYSNPPFKLSDNFKFISLGEQKKYSRDWTSALISYFKQLSDEYFIIFLEDYYIMNTNKSLLKEAEKYMIKGVEKISLRSSSYYPGGFVEKDANFDIAKQDYKYRLALWPQLVRKDYFLKYLIPRKTIWQYETQFNATKNDGAQILAPKQDIVYYANFAGKGKTWGRKELLKIKKEDLDILRHMEIKTGK